MKKEHSYAASIAWVGPENDTAFDYKSYSRNHAVEVDGKQPFEMSADPAFRGDPSKLNPEDCLLVALASCHMLSYLALAAIKGLKIIGYKDRPTGTMIQQGMGGQFSEVILRPEVSIAAGADSELAQGLHEAANSSCFIASSVNFPVKHEPIVVMVD
jgi:organic hydroperoxide reductase OsmC/OhrA